MIITGPWVIYTPENPPVPGNIQWLQDPLGEDWYAYRESISAKNLFLITEDGTVVGTHTDASYLNPVGLRVAETDEVPADFTFSTYTITTAGFIPVELTDDQKVAKNKAKRTSLLSGITGKVTTLQMLANTGAIDADSQAELDRYTTYIKALMEVDLLNPVWPTITENA